MGLDTVELVVRIEKHFELPIPDPVVEQIGTVGEMAAWLGKQLGVEQVRESGVREAVMAQVRTLFAAGAPGLEVRADAALHQWFEAGQAEAHWATQLFATTQLEWPNNAHRHWGRFARLLETNYRQFYQRGTVAELVDWLVARNYQVLLRPPFSSQYDVEQAVIGLTWEQSGVEIPEIWLSSSFTNDLGMD